MSLWPPEWHAALDLVFHLGRAEEIVAQQPSRGQHTVTQRATEPVIRAEQVDTQPAERGVAE